MFGNLANKIIDTITEAKEKLSKEEFEELLEGLQDEIEQIKEK